MTRQWQGTTLVLVGTFILAATGTWTALPAGAAAVNLIWHAGTIRRYLWTGDD